MIDSLISLFLLQYYPGYEIARVIEQVEERYLKVEARQGEASLLCVCREVSECAGSYLVQCQNGVLSVSRAFELSEEGSLKEIGRDLFSIEEVIDHFGEFLDGSERAEVQRLAEREFSSILRFGVPRFGNLLDVSLETIESRRPLDMILTPDASMIWHDQKKRFVIYPGADPIVQTEMGWDPFFLSINGNSTLFLVTHNERWELAEWGDLAKRNERIVFVGHASGKDGRQPREIKLIVDGLETLPDTMIRLEHGQEILSGKGPVLFIETNDRFELIELTARTRESLDREVERVVRSYSSAISAYRGFSIE